MDFVEQPSVLHKLHGLLMLAYLKLAVPPYYALLYAFPGFRGHKSWTWSQAFHLKTFGWLLQYFCPPFQDLATRPITYEPSQAELEKHKVGFTWAPPYQGELKGEIGALAHKYAIQSIPLGVWWYGEGVSGVKSGYKAAPGERTMLYIHGGAFTVGGGHPTDVTSWVPEQLPKYSQTIRRTAAIEYRLSTYLPDHPGRGHPFPTALIDCISTFYYLLSLGFEASNITITGDSAGCNLALALVRYLVLEEKRKLGPLVILSPWADLTASSSDPTSSRAINRQVDIINDLVEASSRAAKAYVGDNSPKNPYISPACKTVDVSFDGFPATYLTVGQLEVLRDDARTLRDRMQAVLGSRFVYEEQPNMPHDVLTISCMEPIRTELLKKLVVWLDQAWE